MKIEGVFSLKIVFSICVTMPWATPYRAIARVLHGHTRAKLKGFKFVFVSSPCASGHRLAYGAYGGGRWQAETQQG